MFKNKLIGISLLSLSVICLIPSEADAYVLLSEDRAPTFNHPKDLFYWIDPDFTKQGKNDLVEQSLRKWNTTPEIQFTKKQNIPGAGDVKIEYVDQYSGGLYAVHKSGAGGRIIVYKKWHSLSDIEERETIVHEVGHALGLDHTQKKYKYVSVMRATGFNSEDHPFDDDKNGIAKRY